ncbi:hypothetical protein KC19_1G096700 [Ceratodon purpureus]|uniref:BTB/POZ domain-containing protein n=1 Tax=Ceratodon purpureus TaxID=3225 RepID=A0A8T0J653_CERPU|nr:hypothetical protein KC19_1G096700 [Ceratodon purpureus]
MPPSQRSSGKSADESSGGRLSGASTKYIDIDIDSDMGGKGSEKRSHTRSDGRPPAAAAGKGNAWGAAELYTNLHIEVGDRSFVFNKFPLISKSGKLNRLVFESRNTKEDRIVLPNIPGGPQAFELVARFLFGEKVELTPRNAAAIRCAAEYLEMTEKLGEGNLVMKAEHYLNYQVLDSWRDCITVLKTCSELTPWAEDLEIVRRCTDAIAHKCSSDPPHGMRWSGSSSSTKARDWWFDDVCSLSIDFFSKVIHSVTGKGQALVPAAVGYYAENWLQLTKGSDMSTTLKLTKSEEPSQAASFMAFTGFNQDIVAKDATQAQHKSRAILQGIVNLLPSQLDSTPVKFLLKLVRVACLVNAGTLCKTDLAKRIGSQLEKVSLDDLLIPSSDESTYDVDIVHQIVEFYIQEQSYGNSPPFSPRSSVTGSSMSGSTSRTSSSSSSLRSLSSVSSSDLSSTSLSRSLSGSSLSGSSITSGSSLTTDSRSGRSVSGSSNSGSSSVRSSDTGSSISRSSSNLSSRSSSFRSTSNSDTTESSLTSHTSSDTSSSSSGISSDESVKLEKKPFYAVTESPSNQRFQLPPTTANFKVAQLLETYLDEISKDSSIPLEKFIMLAELFTEFPRDSDDSIYRAIDGFLRAHPSLTEMERRKLCRVMDPGALSLAASVHAASNERLPLRIIVQLLFSEQIKLRNEMTGNNVINEKDLGDHLPSFSSTTSSSESSSDASSDTTSSTGTTSSSTSVSASTATRSHNPSLSIAKSRTPSLSSASELDLAIAKSPSIASVVSSQLLGGLSIKETLRFVLAEIESLRKSVQEIEAVKSRLSLMDTLQLEMQNLSTKFQEMSHDYVGMTQQVEELTKNSKSAKSGWSSGWKKVAKSFQSKDNQEHSKIETPPLAPVKFIQTPDIPALPSLKTSKSDTLHPKTPRADSTLLTKNGRADSLPVTKTPKADSTLHSKTPRADSLPVGSKIIRGESLPIPKTANVAEMCPRTPRADPKPAQSVLSTPSVSLKKDSVIETLAPRESFKVSQETPKSGTPTSNSKQQEKDMAPASTFKDRRKEDYNITSQRSQHVEDVHRRSVRSRSTSPGYIRPPRHQKDSDSVSVTSTSSYSSYSSYGTTSSTVSGHSGHRYRARVSHDRSTSKNGSLDKRHSHHHHIGTHKSERSAGHRRQVRVGSEENHGPSHRKHRQTEGPEHHSTSHHSGQKDHLSVDSHPRHSVTPSHHSGHHRHKEGSITSHHTKDGSEHHSSRRSGHRKDRYKQFSKQSSPHQQQHPRHHSKEILSDSDGNIDSGPRRRHRS